MPKDIQYTQLLSILKKTLEALKLAQKSVCSLLCPSVWKTGNPQLHTYQCKMVSDVINEGEKQLNNLEKSDCTFVGGAENPSGYKKLENV